MEDVVARLHRARAEAARLQSWSVQIAAAVAVTEQESMALLETLAETVPRQAEDLHRQAEHARSFSTTERLTAEQGHPPTADDPG